MNASAEGIVFLVLVLLVGGFFAARLIISVRLRRIVSRSSSALEQLRQLNAANQHRVQYPSPIAYSWEDRVDSKAKFDRYDLNKFFQERISAFEYQIDQQIAQQLEAVEQYAQYQQAYDQLGQTTLGTSGAEGEKPERFNRVEAKMFTKQRLRQPVPVARINCSVSYTSPQGRNSYRNTRSWNFDQLRYGLHELRELRATQSTATFLRQQERQRMTADMRFQVLKRDNNRCRACGATSEVEVLHIDHIHPVSKGGKTEMDNLQTLCQSCNLGKSNRH